MLIRRLSELGIKGDLINGVCRDEVGELFADVCERVYSKRIWFYPHSSLGWVRLNERRGLIQVLRWMLLYPWGCFTLFSVLWGSKYQIVHFNSATLIAYGWVPCVLRVPLVCHIREPFAKGHRGVRRFLLRSLLRVFSRRAVAICEDNASDTRLKSVRCPVIYNPVDHEQFDPGRVERFKSRSDLGITSSDAFFALLLVAQIQWSRESASSSRRCAS